MRIDGDRFERLSLHHAVRADDFCDFAADLRDELLRFPRWKPMRLGSGANYSFQTALTTGHIQGRYEELAFCHRFANRMVALADELCAVVGATPTPPLGIDMSAMAYGEGGQLKPHTDGVGSRMLAWILYLTAPDDGEWTAADGGDLALGDGAEASLGVQIFPRFNRFAAFQVSDQSWHQIREVRRPTPWPAARLALSGWIDQRVHVPL